MSISVFLRRLCLQYFIIFAQWTANKLQVIIFVFRTAWDWQGGTACLWALTTTSTTDGALPSLSLSLEILCSHLNTRIWFTSIHMGTNHINLRGNEWLMCYVTMMWFICDECEKCVFVLFWTDETKVTKTNSVQWSVRVGGFAFFDFSQPKKTATHNQHPMTPNKTLGIFLNLTIYTIEIHIFDMVDAIFTSGIHFIPVSRTGSGQFTPFYHRQQLLHSTPIISGECNYPKSTFHYILTKCCKSILQSLIDLRY